MIRTTCSISRNAKLGLTAQNAIHSVYLFPEGLFVRAYNQSAYILTQVLGYDLKVNFSASNHAKKPLVYCGVRFDRLSNHFKHAQITEYGYYILHGKFDLSNYQNWINQGVNGLFKQADEKGTGNAVFEDIDENTNWESPDDLNEIAIELTEEQVEFLTHWEPDLFTTEQNNEFIESLRQFVIK